MSRTLCVVVAVLGLTSIVAFGQSKPDPNILMGTWKLNVATAKYTPGPAPKSQTLTFKPTATGFTSRLTRSTLKVKRRRRTIMGRSTGKPYPVKFANLSRMQTTKWDDAFTLTEVNTLDGKVRTSRTGVISKDGKTLTITSKGVNAQGQPTNNTGVYEKQ